MCNPGSERARVEAEWGDINSVGHRIIQVPLFVCAEVMVMDLIAKLLSHSKTASIIRLCDHYLGKILKSDH